MKNLNFMFLFLIFSCSGTPDLASTNIGFENEGESTYDITAGESASTAVVSSFINAVNQRDMETMRNLQFEDIVIYGPEGNIEGVDQHITAFDGFLKTYPDANWKIKWSMSSNVVKDDVVENWVTTNLLLTFGEGEVSEVVDANIVDGKIKTIYLYTGQQKMNSEKSSD
tara:strand:- start:74 stop:580 length:507 start_codon:yes stop_codon:yes gene_type:complete